MIPKSLYDQPAMLAQQSKTINADVDDAVAALFGAKNTEWYADLKYDGIRCIAYVSDGKAKLLNRTKLDITFRYPDLVAQLETVYAKHDMAFDGEIIVFRDGLPNFADAHRRDAQQNEGAARALAKALPATFMIFDVLFADGDDLRRLPYVARRAMLKSISERMHVASNDVLQWSRSEREGAAMWDFVKQVGMEGLIAKKATALYSGGRSSSWVKLKPVRSLTAIVTGSEPGKNARAATFGNLTLALLNEDMKLVPIGSVGSGFTEAALHDMVTRLNNPVTPILVEVEFQEASAAGQLRFPVFKGIRTDIAFTDCTLDQLK